MKFGRLLEKLIAIAQIPKTDFSIGMNMTPSGLSKILTGKRLPSLKEKKLFSKQASRLFAEAVYSQGCYLKLADLFPVIYNFNSESELQMFLVHAIEYAWDQDFDAEREKNTDYPDAEKSFLGRKKILNMFCVILSDSAVNSRAPGEFYSTLPLFSHLYSDIFRRIKVVGTAQRGRPAFHHFFDMSAWETSFDNCNTDIFTTITEAEQHVDLNLWRISGAIGSSFLLLRGQYLLIFSIQMDGTPLMTLIAHRSYLSVFFDALMKKGAKKISYNRNEATEFLLANPSFIADLINRRIDTAYNFTYIGYLVQAEELAGAAAPETVKRGILKLFNSILTRDTTFFVTLDAMSEFYSSGKVIVPLVSTVDIARDDRVPYLQRFNKFVRGNRPNKVRILYREMPRMAALCLKGLSLIYLNTPKYGSEKIHCFESDFIGNIFADETASGSTKILEFSPELWDSYLKGLSKDSAD